MISGAVRLGGRALNITLQILVPTELADIKISSPAPSPLELQIPTMKWDRITSNKIGALAVNKSAAVSHALDSCQSGPKTTSRCAHQLPFWGIQPKIGY